VPDGCAARRAGLTECVSLQECLNACRELLRNSAPVLFFPEARASCVRSRACADMSPACAPGDALRHWPDGGVQEGRLHCGGQGERARHPNHPGRHGAADAQRCAEAAVATAVERPHLPSPFPAQAKSTPSSPARWSSPCTRPSSPATRTRCAQQHSWRCRVRCPKPCTTTPQPERFVNILPASLSASKLHRAVVRR